MNFSSTPPLILDAGQTGRGKIGGPFGYAHGRQAQHFDRINLPEVHSPMVRKTVSGLDI
jgi:hypothetical protein